MAAKAIPRYASRMTRIAPGIPPTAQINTAIGVMIIV